MVLEKSPGHAQSIWYIEVKSKRYAMRTKRKRKKGRYGRRIVGKNCKYLLRAGRTAKCGLRAGEYCNKTRECGYEEESRIIGRLIERL